MLRTLNKARFFQPFNNKRTLATIANSTNLENVYDIVIIGGGVAGVSLACSLASRPSLRQHRIALVEAMDLTNVRNWEPKEDDFSNRVVSLTPGSLGFFEEIGITKHMALDRANGFRDMQVWDGITGANIHLDSAVLKNYGADKNVKENTIAYMVENVNIQSAALKRMEECRTEGVQIDLLQKVKVSEIKKTKSSEEGEDVLDLEDWPTIHLDNGKQLKARLLIGADGINSPVRSFANIDSLGWDYDAHGVVATLKLDPERPNNTAWQRFLPTGPIAMLPLNEEYASMVWSIKPSIAQAIKKLPPAEFCSLVNAAYRMTNVDLKYLYKQIESGTTKCDIGDEYAWRESVANTSLTEQEKLDREYTLPPQVIDVKENSRASFPFRMKNAERYVSDRIALVGDAAHATHPLAGQGMNQGILDVECLSQILERGVTEGQDIGSIHLLRQYSSERYLRNIMMISSCDKLHRLFSNDIGPVTWIRSIGLNAVNNMDFLKAEFIKYAMGIEQTGGFRH